jgi:dolichyl-diphosphooligosaccharide--protein glycosyltransferase
MDLYLQSSAKFVVALAVAINFGLIFFFEEKIQQGSHVLDLLGSRFGSVISFVLPPLSALALSLSTYLIGSLIGSDTNDGIGIFASAFAVTSPAILSRSLQSIDAECTLILPLLAFALFAWLRSVKATSIALCSAWACVFTTLYGALFIVWKDDVDFISWIIPLHGVLLQFSNQGGQTLHFTYSIWFAFISARAFGGILGDVQPGLQNCAFLSALPTFCVLQAAFIWRVLKSISSNIQAIPDAFAAIVVGLASAVFASQHQLDWDALEGPLDPSVPRRIGGSDYPLFSLYSMWPENQPSSFQNLVFDHGPMLIFAAFGIVLCIIRMRPGDLLSLSLLLPFLYFTLQFRRLSIFLALALSLLAGTSFSYLNKHFSTSLFEIVSSVFTRQKISKSLLVTSLTGIFICLLGLHFWSAVESVFTVLSAPTGGTFAAVHANNTRFEMNDIVDAGLWLRNHSPSDARILSWTTHGHEVAFYSQRQLVKGCEHRYIQKNDTSIVARAFLSQGAASSTLIRDELKADYVVVVFGGYVGLVQDDLEYILWMARVSDAYPKPRGAKQLPIPNERELLTRKKELRIDAGGAPALLQSTLFMLSYFRFNEKMTDEKRPTGFDRARKTVSVKVTLDANLFEEVYTSKHWIARVYRVKKSNEDESSFSQKDDLLNALNAISYEEDEL